MKQNVAAGAKTDKPRFFYGYIIVIASFFILIAYSSSRGAFGVFFNPMATEFGWSSALVSGIMSLSMVGDGSMGVVMGRLADRLGTRWIVTIFGCLMGIGYIFVSRVTSVWQMYLVYGVIVGCGMGGIYVPLVTSINRWFIARRTTMSGIVLCGLGVGTLAVSPVAHWLISTYDWRPAYVILGVAFLVIIITAAQFMKKSPAETGQLPYNKGNALPAEHKPDAPGFSLGEAVRTRQFQLTFFVFFCYGFFSLTAIVHTVPNIIHLNISASTAAYVLATIGGGNIAGRLGFGIIADRIGNRVSNSICLSIIAASVCGLIFIREAWIFFLFAVFFGIAQGGMGAIQAPLMAELFGLKSHGFIFGVCGLGATLGAAVGPLLSGYIYDITGGYQMVFLVCTLVVVSGFIISLIIARRQTFGRYGEIKA
jgi:MFS family permease